MLLSPNFGVDPKAGALLAALHAGRLGVPDRIRRDVDPDHVVATLGEGESAPESGSWCGRRESNPPLMLGKHTYYRYTTPADNPAKKNGNAAGRNHEYARRPSRALLSVTESAYSTPPPLGRPNPIRVTCTGRPMVASCSVR